MASTELLERDPQAEITAEKLNAKLAKEMEQVLADAERKSLAQAEAKNSWAYRIPSPGVRYYTY